MNCLAHIENLKAKIEILEDLKNIGMDTEKDLQEKKEVLNKCLETLKRLKKPSVEYRLFTLILDGYSPTKAVEMVANENYINDRKPTDLSTIWKHYKKLKKSIKS